jgi:hypothetical protein
MLLLGNALFVVGSPAFGCDLIVNKTEGPYTSISAAIAAAPSGATICVAPGCYGEGCPGAPDPVVIGKALTLKGSGPNGPMPGSIIMPVNAVGVRVLTNVVGVTIRGFTITGASDGISSAGGGSISILNNVILQSSRFGVVGEGGASLLVRNNTIIDNGSDGVRANGDCGGPSAVATVENNIIAGNARCGVERCFASVVVAKNDLWNNAAGPCAPTADLTPVEPGFLDAAAGNHTLASNSPLIDAGRNLAALQDPDGSRNDVGAYGGPGAADFWPYPASGPIIEELSITPSSVPQGGTITIRATGRIRTSASD